MHHNFKALSLIEISSNLYGKLQNPFLKHPLLILTLFPMGYFPTDFPWQVVAASPAYANDFLNFWKFQYEIC